MWPLAAVLPLQAQTDTLWTRTVSACHEAVSAAVAPEGGYVVAGNRSEGGNRTICLARVTAQGAVLWQKTITSSGAPDVWAASMATAPDGGYVIAGGRNPDSGDTDGYLVKIDEAGTVVWERIVGGEKGDFFEAIVSSADGGYVLAGTTASFGDTASGGDIYLVKTDGDGMRVWQQTIDNAYVDRGEAVTETPEGDIVAAGWTQALPLDPPEIQQLVVRTDATGALQWKQSFRSQRDSTDSSAAYGVAPTATGGALVAGWADNFITGTHGYLVATDMQGALLSAQVFNAASLGENVLFSETEVRAITRTSDGGYVLGGHVVVTKRPIEDSDSNMYLAKLDPAGRLEREELVPGVDLEDARAIVETHDGGYVLVGRRRAAGSSVSSMYIARITLDTNTGLATPPRKHPAFPSLKKNYPNPFKNRTVIEYTLLEAGHVRLVIYDVLGREVSVLADGVQATGKHRVPFDATDVPSGIYLYRLQAGIYEETRTMAVLK